VLGEANGLSEICIRLIKYRLLQCMYDPLFTSDEESGKNSFNVFCGFHEDRLKST
jgi:hypothetical protein